MRPKGCPSLPRLIRAVLAIGIAIVVSMVALPSALEHVARADDGGPASSVPPPPAHVARHTVSPLVLDRTLDRATPRRALQSFLDATRDGDFLAASHCLDLRGTPDVSNGPELAEELSYVLYRRAPIDLMQVPDEPGAHDGRVTVETFTVGEQEVPLLLVRQAFDDGIERWVISRATVRRIPDIAATLRAHAWEQRLPHALRWPVIFGNAPWQWLGILVGLFVAYVGGRSGALVGSSVAASVARRGPHPIILALVHAAERPLRTILASTIFAGLGILLQTSLEVTRLLEHVAYTGFIIGAAWLLLASFDAVAPFLSPAPTMTGDLDLDRAGDRTRRALLQRVAAAGIVGVAVALLLVQFDIVRHVGLSILASAGIAGVVVGLAAQKSLAGLIAGIQLSITQPIRLGDTILIDGEVGLVQDIFLTYAVIRYWDDRCVVVPLSRFIDQPFQNWTLIRHDLSAVVQLHVKFTAPIEKLRGKARELCEANPRWDRVSCELQVGEADMYGMILRVAVSARSPAEAWHLRCAVREGLLVFLQTLDGGVHMG